MAMTTAAAPTTTVIAATMRERRVRNARTTAGASAIPAVRTEQAAAATAMPATSSDTWTRPLAAESVSRASAAATRP